MAKGIVLMSRGKWYKKYDSVDDLLESLLTNLSNEEFVYVQQLLYIINDMRSKILDVMTNNMKKYGYIYYKSEETGQSVFMENYYEEHVINAYDQLIIKIIQWFVRYKKWNEDQCLIDHMLIKAAVNHSNTLIKELSCIKNVENFPYPDDDDDEFDEHTERDPYLVYNKRGELDKCEWVDPVESLCKEIDIEEYLTYLRPSEWRVIELKYECQRRP